MIAKRKNELIQNGSSWQTANSTDRPAPAISIKERLASLNDSAKDWQKRVCSPVSSSNSSSSTPRRFIRAPVLKELPDNTPKRTNISSGVSKFFSEAGVSSKICGDDIDLDAISCSTPTLTMPSRPRAPTRAKGKKSVRDERMDFDKVQIENSFVEEADEEVKAIDTQEEAIRALKDTKKLLKSPVRKCPYPDVMVIQVRGAKCMDVRLVSPSISSIHELGCFIIVTRSDLIKYEGAYANILEKTKATQICIDIISRSDLFCAAEKTVEIKGPDNARSLAKLLNSNENKRKVEDEGNINEPFENIAAQLNLVIRINEDHSIQSLKKAERVSISLLHPAQTLIFDFGSEIYVWSGRQAPKVDGIYAQEYAKQLLEKPVNSAEPVVGEALVGPRPSWVLSRRVFQGVQDVLFKSKFVDWESKEMVLTTCRPSPRISPNFVSTPKRRHVQEDAITLAGKMKESEIIQPVTTLEDQEITRNLDEVISEELDLWNLEGENLAELQFTSVFVSNKCYVLRWKYRIQKAGVRRLKTGQVEDRETGRTRIAFFYWLGNRTLPKQHGLCALRIKDLDKDNSPRIRIVQGFEPALFLSLFEKSFTVRNDAGPEEPILCVLGGTEKETHLCEVDASQPLRSHAVYVHFKRKPIIIAGASCSKELVKFAFKHTDTLAEDVEIIVEGDNKSFKWIKSSRREKAIRAWRFFESEIEALSHPHDHHICPFTFSQQSLVDTIILDVGDQLWVWSEKTVSTQALKVSFEFWKDRRGAAAVVHRGAEPDEFKALFMQWSDFEPKEEEKPMRPRNLKNLLDERCQNFSLNDLKARKNLPEGMDMRQLEEYLTENDFETTFKMNRDSFYSIPEWKQIEMRKSVGLF